jgi:hypothetical protein
MAGVFKRLSANDIKITPFEAHKKYSSTNLSTIGVSTDFVSWSPYNKAYYLDGNRKYSQINKLYYRDYVRERAHRLELDDATYTTQERRLYDFATVISMPQRNFGNEVQPKTFVLSCSYSSSGEDFNIQDDGFGNLYDVDRGGDNFPNEDYRLLYLGPTQAFKRADLTIDYETGKKYVNDPFPNGYTRTVYDDSYFLNEVEFNSVNFVTSSNSGFYSIKTSTPKVLSVTESADLLTLFNNGNLTVDLASGVSEDSFSGGAEKLFDTDTTSTGNGTQFAIDDVGGSPENIEIFTLNFYPPIYTSEATISTKTRLTDVYDVKINGDDTTTQTYTVAGSVLSAETSELAFSNLEKLESITYLLSGAYSDTFHHFLNISLDVNSITENKSNIKIPHQPQFNFETDDNFTINFYYDLNQVDHGNSKVSGDYFILTKEGTKSVPILPSEGTQHTPLSRSGSSQIGTSPIGTQFPYRIYYKGNHPNNNTASLFFERSDGENTQFISASFFLSGSTDTKKFVSCKNDNGELKLTINDQIVSSSEQNSPTLSQTVSNKANITLYNKPKPDGSYSNFIGYEGGQISQLMMWNQALSVDAITKVSESVVGTPNIGNIFYDNGFAVITHPSYKNVLSNYDFNGYNSVTSASISSSALSFSRPGGGSFNDDGTKLILTSDQTDSTVEFTLSTPFDVTSFTTSRSFDYGNNKTSLVFNNVGSKVYFNEGNTIKSFILSSSYDLGSGFNENSVTITNPNSDSYRSIAWSNDGFRFFTGTVNGDINQYIAKDPFDLDNLLYDHTYNVGHIGDIQGIRFDKSGYKLFVIHTVSGTGTFDSPPWEADQSYITQYVLDRPFDLKSINIDNRFNSIKGIHAIEGDSSNIISRPSEILLNNDGTKAYITQWASVGGSDTTKADYIWQFDLPQHIDKFEYKNTHLITENEYQCTMTEDEFEFTTNPTARKIPFSDSEDIADFTTGSNFKPYITSVGLYDDMGNLLVVGKLGQPIKASSETDTTFVIRYDT